MPYFTKRPVTIHAIQWTGNNLAAIEAWCAEFNEHLLPLTDNEDGTFYVAVFGDSGGYTLWTDDWLSTLGRLTPADMEKYQEVSAAVVEFDITASA